MKYITVEEMNEACDNEYKENYSHGEYCNEQSFRFGFQEGVEFSEEKIIEKACKWLKNELIEDVVEPNPYYHNDVKSKTYDFVENFIKNFRKAMKGE